MEHVTVIVNESVWQIYQARKFESALAAARAEADALQIRHPEWKLRCSPVVLGIVKIK